MALRVGDMVPEFEMAGYHEERFTKIRMADLKGKWVLLYFYGGDFTFV